MQHVTRHDHIGQRAPVLYSVAWQGLKLASEACHSPEASRLVGRMYAKRGLDVRAHQEVRPQSNMLVINAASDGTVFGTMTLNFDAGGGLNAEATYGNEIAMLRQRGARICEITQLAVDIDRGSKPLLATLFQLAHIHSRQIRRMTDVVIEVHPRHAPFYMRMLGFRRLGQETICPRVNAPAVLLHGDLSHADEQIAKHAGFRVPGVKSLYPYFLPATEQHKLLTLGG